MPVARRPVTETHAAPRTSGAPRAVSPLVIALGGNALPEPAPLSLPVPGRGASTERPPADALTDAADQLARLAAAGHPLVITHGNGPQVGRALVRAAIAEAEGQPPLPMDDAVAHTQGELGYQLARALGNALAERGIDRPIAALLTQVEVDPDDPAFASPSKPIGAWMSRVRAQRLARTRGWHVRHFPPEGWRRVVASPRPVAVLSLPAIRALLAADHIVIANGGGGVPVVPTPYGYRGVAAVIDKDRSSSLLARGLHAAAFVIATDVPQVVLGYGGPSALALSRLSPDDAAAYLAEGQFPPGSMGPKVEAAAAFARATGRPAHITRIDALEAALAGEAGTTIAQQADGEG